MNPSPDAIAAIRAHVTDWTPTNAAILSALNALSVANPDSQGQIPAPIYESALIPLLNDPTNGSVSKLLNWSNFGLVKADIDSANRTGLMLWAAKLQMLGIITSGEATSLAAYLNSTVADPAWTAQISWAQANLGRPVDAADIAAARPSGS